MVALSEPPSRWWEYASERRLFCGPRPGGHHIPSTFHILECGFVRCNHWNGLERRECGLWVFAFAIRGGRLVVARVELNEIDSMRKLVTPSEIIDYLGIWAVASPPKVV